MYFEAGKSSGGIKYFSRRNDLLDNTLNANITQAVLLLGYIKYQITQVTCHPGKLGQSLDRIPYRVGGKVEMLEGST